MTQHTPKRWQIQFCSYFSPFFLQSRIRILKLSDFHTAAVLTIGTLPSELFECTFLAKICNEKRANKHTEQRAVGYVCVWTNLIFILFFRKKNKIKSVVRVILCVLEACYYEWWQSLVSCVVGICQNVQRALITLLQNNTVAEWNPTVLLAVSIFQLQLTSFWLIFIGISDSKDSD